MVSILPTNRSPWEAISNSIGEGLSQTLPQAAQQRSQRETGLNAIDQLQRDLQASGGDITKMLPAVMKAYTLNPALERSGIAEKLIPLAQRSAATSQFPVGGKGTGTGLPTQEDQEQQKPLSINDLVQPRSSVVQTPQGTTDFQLPYGPEDIANIRQKSRQMGLLPEVEERLVNDANEYNKIAQTKRDVELQNYQQQQQERRDTIENQRLFADYMKNNAKELWDNPDDREIALKAAEKALAGKDSTSFADALSKVKNEIRPYQASKKALEKTLKRPFVSKTKSQRELDRRRAQKMIDMGQKHQLQLMIANGGNGEVEEADLINPLPENIEYRLSTLPKFVNALENVNVDPTSPLYEKQIESGMKARDKQLNNVIDYLSQEIRPGADYNHPGTNLLLTRYHLMQKGMGYNEAARVIDQAIEKGKIKLDPHQEIDYQKLAYPPLTGETYFDTIMNNIMFGITGKK
jgi:hypothetical protein